MPRVPEELKRAAKEGSLGAAAGGGAGHQAAAPRGGPDGAVPVPRRPNPSLVITPGKNLWHCLGACDAGGTAIDWVMRAEGISFRHAVELLRADYLPLAAAPIQPVKHGTVRKLPPPVARDADDRVLLMQVVDYYNETLKQSPEALKYLESRGLQSSEMIDRFRLGFANRTLGYRLPAKNRAAGAEMRGHLQQLGIYRESGHEHFNGSVVIPVFNAAGEVVEMYGRKITPNLREGTPNHLYLPGPHAGRVERRGAGRIERNHPVRSADRCADVLVRGHPPRDRELRRERLHRRSQAGLHASTARSAFTSPTTATKPETAPRSALERADGDGHRVLPGAVPEGHGRQRIRAEGAASGEESGRAAE